MRSNYIDILSNKVEIPIIQRDYAQGRTDDKTNKIRKDFLDVLFDFIKQKHLQASSSEIELDFIYGFNEQDITNQTTFIPIDGQQRLTTLWLLYWFVSIKENVPQSDKQFLANFIYETRHSTTEFCRRLVQYKPKFSHDSISAELKNQAWYFETWDYDPSIQAMLVSLNDIEIRYGDLKIPALWSIIGGSACPFYFYKLDMDKVGLTDDLYIKMNSRGKALTEFEYFKAGFLELLTSSSQKERFENSIDGEWIDAIWNIVFESSDISEDEDIALTVDNSFLNLFNFITSVIAFKNDIKTDGHIRYKDTVASADLVKTIYNDTRNQDVLFDTLDALCDQQKIDPSFWNNLFYFEKNDFADKKTRLFFQHEEVNLLKQCLFYFSENRGLSFPEQLLLHACFTQMITPSEEFADKIRVIRNLAINSENELRDTILGSSFIEVEQFVRNGDLNIFKSFNTEQIEEEKRKKQFLSLPFAKSALLKQIEDSEILRGRISLLPLDNSFSARVEKFLEHFEEDEFIAAFNDKCNLLLSFGDYSQDDDALTNLMSPNKAVIRDFMTAPGYNKLQFINKTQKTVLSCLDYFIANAGVTADQKVQEILTGYKSNPKDWKYYFMSYPSFRQDCTKGYFCWYDDSEYRIWKMRVRQFNGYHWDPFLYEIKRSILPKNLTLDMFGAKLLFTLNRKKIFISSVQKGFLIENAMSAGVTNSLFDDLKSNGTINNEDIFIVTQNNAGLDMEDRIELIKSMLLSLVN
jgi:hypothetical protein